MTVTIADAFVRIHGQQPPVPVILFDTCSLLDLFRPDDKTCRPRARVEEIRAAADLLELMIDLPNATHLIVPELIPREYADHADKIQVKFGDWTGSHDWNQEWITEASLCVGLALPAPLLVHPLGIADRLRALADNLLAKAMVLDRDQGCLDRAVHRLINRIRPSHKKEMKDSMNLEQCLELSLRLQNVGFLKSRVWISSNTNDFAQTPTNNQLHSDLQGDFTAAGLRYFTSLRAAMGQLRAAGEIP